MVLALPCCPDVYLYLYFGVEAVQTKQRPRVFHRGIHQAQFSGGQPNKQVARYLQVPAADTLTTAVWQVPLISHHTPVCCLVDRPRPQRGQPQSHSLLFLQAGEQGRRHDRNCHPLPKSNQILNLLQENPSLPTTATTIFFSSTRRLRRDTRRPLYRHHINLGPSQQTPGPDPPSSIRCPVQRLPSNNTRVPSDSPP